MDELNEYVVIAPKGRVWDANERADEKNTANRGKGGGKTYGQTVAMTEEEAAGLLRTNVIVSKADYKPRTTDDAAVQLAEAKADNDAMAAKLAELEGDKPNKGGRPRKADAN